MTVARHITLLTVMVRIKPFETFVTVISAHFLGLCFCAGIYRANAENVMFYDLCQIVLF